MKNWLLTFILHGLFCVMAVQSACATEPVQLRILYLNDFHGYAEPYPSSGHPEKLGGAAFLADEIQRQRENHSTLLLAAGDLIQGNPWANLFEGKSTIEWMNALDFSAMTLGNHEFDFGVDVLNQRVRQARFPVLAANVRGLPSIQPYVIKELSGLKVAIVGLVTEDTPVTTHPKNVKGLTFSPVADAAQKIITELNNRADLIIVLSHLGFAGDIQLAKTVKGIHVIVGGHSHTRVEKPMKVDETLIVQAWEHAKALGILDLTIQERKVIQYDGRLAFIEPEKGKPDPVTLEIIDRYQKKAADILNEVIGEAQVDLKGKTSRSGETNLGNLVADILRQKTGSDLALINGGGIRADILKGPIRMNDILSVLPFTNHPVVLKVSGNELKDIFEYGIADLDGTAGRFPQVSGIKITYQAAHPIGQRITRMTIAEAPVKPEGWYTLVTNDFLAAGGDGYVTLKNILDTMDSKASGSTQDNRVLLFDSGRPIRDIVIDFIKEKKNVSANVEDRIKKED